MSFTSTEPGQVRSDTFHKHRLSNSRRVVFALPYVQPKKKHGSCTLHPHLIIEKVFWKMSFFHNDLFDNPLQLCMVVRYTQYDAQYKNNRTLRDHVQWCLVNATALSTKHFKFNTRYGIITLPELPLAMGLGLGSWGRESWYSICTSVHPLGCTHLYCTKPNMKTWITDQSNSTFATSNIIPVAIMV